MTFVPKAWRDAALGPDGLPVDPQPAGSTPWDAEAAIDLEERMVAAQHVHVQGAPSAVWTIDHGLGKYPAVSVVDSAGEVVLGDVAYPSGSQVRVSFRFGFSGRAYLN